MRHDGPAAAAAAEDDDGIFLFLFLFLCSPPSFYSLLFLYKSQICLLSISIKSM